MLEFLHFRALFSSKKVWLCVTSIIRTQKQVSLYCGKWEIFLFALDLYIRKLQKFSQDWGYRFIVCLEFQMFDDALIRTCAEVRWKSKNTCTQIKCQSIMFLPSTNYGLEWVWWLFLFTNIFKCTLNCFKSPQYLISRRENLHVEWIQHAREVWKSLSLEQHRQSYSQRLSHHNGDDWNVLMRFVLCSK